MFSGGKLRLIKIVCYAYTSETATDPPANIIPVAAAGPPYPNPRKYPDRVAMVSVGMAINRSLTKSKAITTNR
jgi:hypothetical protein